MREPSYDRMSKKALIDRLIEAERRLHTVGAEKTPVSAPAVEAACREKIGVERSPRSGIGPNGSETGQVHPTRQLRYQIGIGKRLHDP